MSYCQGEIRVVRKTGVLIPSAFLQYDLVSFGRIIGWVYSRENEGIELIAEKADGFGEPIVARPFRVLSSGEIEKVNEILRGKAEEIRERGFVGGV